MSRARGAPPDEDGRSTGPGRPAPDPADRRETPHPPSAGPHLVLIGLPGAGKSTVGAAVAARLGRPFLDLDQEIERATGCTVAELFARDGEPRFRALERALTADLVGREAMVLSPGGGWVADPGNVALLRPRARIILLSVSPEAALQRLGAAGALAARPLLAGNDPLATIVRLAERRAEAYASADAVVETEAKSLQRVIDEVVSLATSGGQG